MTKLSDTLAQSLEECERETLTVFLDVEDAMQLLHQNFGHLFKGYEEPVYYLPNVFHPVLDLKDKAGDYYIHKTTPAGKVVKRKVQAIVDLRDGDLVDHKGRIVCKQSNFPHLTNHPWYPKHELDFIWLYISAWLRNRNPFHRSTRAEEWDRRIMGLYFTSGVFVNLEDPDDEAVNDCIERRGQVRQILDPLIHVLEKQLSDNKWLMFDVEQSYFDLIVRQQGDIRAYLWTQQMLEKQADEKEPTR